jgi:hypothetical protein
MKELEDLPFCWEQTFRVPGPRDNMMLSATKALSSCLVLRSSTLSPFSVPKALLVVGVGVCLDLAL